MFSFLLVKRSGNALTPHWVLGAPVRGKEKNSWGSIRAEQMSCGHQRPWTGSFRPVNRVVLTIPLGHAMGMLQAHQGLPGPCMVRPDPLPSWGLWNTTRSRRRLLRCDGREKGPFPASLGHTSTVWHPLWVPYILPETCSSPQETSINQEKSIKWQIFRAYNRSGSNISGAALGELYSSPASAWFAGFPWVNAVPALGPDLSDVNEGNDFYKGLAWTW